MHTDGRRPDISKATPIHLAPTFFYKKAIRLVLTFNHKFVTVIQYNTGIQTKTINQAIELKLKLDPNTRFASGAKFASTPVPHKFRSQNT